MHLWPSATLRASFKLDYLNNLEWNLRRMKSEKNKKNQSSGSSNEEKLLLSDATDSQNRSSNDCSRACGAVLRDLLMVFSCCFCCYCCGACADQ